MMKNKFNLIIIYVLTFSFTVVQAKTNHLLNSSLIDVNYVGDVSGLSSVFKHLDSSLKILPYAGIRKNINVNLNLHQVSFQDISDTVINQTNNLVALVYDNSKNSLQLTYTPHLDVGEDAIKESLKWQNGHAPLPILQADGVVRFPYGLYEPIVNCQAFNLCDIELQQGEEIQGIVIGDSLRWNQGDQGIPTVFSGQGKELTPHLVLKPNQNGLETSLVITTSRRTYMIKLRSSTSNYVARIGFYYPGEIIQKIKNENKIEAESMDEADDINSTITMPMIDLAKINYNYTIENNDYIWSPVKVFDDGISVYIQLPLEVSSRSLPTLCIVANNDYNGKNCEMVNFRFKNHFYIVDKLFDQAILVNGFGEKVETIRLKREETKKGFWAKLFRR
jgi:P-type conjugative transfer protein TrbG